MLCKEKGIVDVLEKINEGNKQVGAMSNAILTAMVNSSSALSTTDNIFPCDTLEKMNQTNQSNAENKVEIISNKTVAKMVKAIRVK